MPRSAALQRSPKSAGTWFFVALLCFASLGALSAAPARSASAWILPADLSSPGARRAPQVVFDDAGNATAIWKRRDGSNFNVETATHLVGNSWSAPEVLATSEGTEEPFTPPQIVVDDAGNAVAIWIRHNDLNQRIVESARRAAGGPWSAPEQLAPASFNAFQACISMNSTGDSIAAWVRRDGAIRTIESARYSIGGGWSAFRDLPAVESFQPRVAIDRAGDSVAVWRTEAGVVESSASVSNGWTAPIVLSTAGVFATDPSVAVDEAGNAVAIWLQGDRTSTLVVEASRHPRGGAWSPAEALSPLDVEEPQLDSDGAGNAVAIWGHNGRIESAALAANNWTAPLSVSDFSGGFVGFAREPQVSVGDAGDAVAVWRANGSSDQVVESARYSFGGSWSAPEELSHTEIFFGGPQVAANSAGEAIAVWSTFDEERGIVEAAPYDATAPQIRGHSTPRGGPTGRPLAFSASTFDTWSLGETRWRFGDGSSAIGSAQAHSFNRPGAFEVTATATDRPGNTATATATVLISQAKALSSIAKVKEGRARLTLRCVGAIPCEGALVLTTFRRKGKKPIRLAHRAFKSPAGKKRAFSIKLNGAARRLLAKAPRRNVKLSGIGVKPAILRLRIVKRPMPATSIRQGLHSDHGTMPRSGRGG